MKKPRVVILGGAGMMGRITAEDLRWSSRGKVEVVIADRDFAPARELDASIERVKVDVTSPRSLGKALKGASVTIASLPYRFNLEAMHGALAARSHYVDLGGLYHVTKKQLKLNGEFKTIKRHALLGIGSAPGILNVLAVLAARDMDRVTEIHCMVGASDRTRYANVPPMGFGYSPDTLLDEFVKPSAVFRDGKDAFVPALDPGESIDVKFPEPVGKIRIDTTLHSEVATLPASFRDRGVREVTFRQGFDPVFADRLRFLVELGLMETDPLPRTGVAPRSVFLELVGRHPPAKAVGKPNKYEILRTLVRGRRDGRPIAVAADCHAGPTAGRGVGPDIDTGAPPSIVAQLLITGEMDPVPGVHAPENVVPVEPFVRELERRGMRVTRTVLRESGARESARAR